MQPATDDLFFSKTPQPFALGIQQHDIPVSIDHAEPVADGAEDRLQFIPFPGELAFRRATELLVQLLHFARRQRDGAFQEFVPLVGL